MSFTYCPGVSFATKDLLPLQICQSTERCTLDDCPTPVLAATKSLDFGLA